MSRITLDEVDQQRRVGVGSGAILGRSRASEVHCPQPWVSARHARLECGAAGWHITDLGSRNGTAVNGRRLPPGVPSPLLVGDVIALGQVETKWVVAAIIGAGQ